MSFSLGLGGGGDPWYVASLTVLFLVLAVLYAAVGQGGGSGYLAAMALLGVPPEDFRTIALTLNVVVASIGLFRFARAGHFRGRELLPFAGASVPAAFLGGTVTLPLAIFRPLVGIVLLWAAVLLFWRPAARLQPATPRPPLFGSLAVGGGVGLLSGLVGIGGGVILAPILILSRWASAHRTAALSAGFILVNSVAGLLGVLTHHQAFPTLMPVWMGVVAAGGWLGAGFGARRLSPVVLQRVLAVVLVVAASRMVLGS